MDVLADRVLALGPKPEPGGPYRHFKLTRDADGVAWLLFDRDGASANTLSAEVIEELDKVLAAEQFNQGFKTTEYLAASLLDQSWHQLTPDQVPTDTLAFEADALKKAGVAMIELKRVSPPSGVLIWLATPKLLRRAGE